jgi:4-hydroxy-2-oxoheptanedioate aldolase
MTAVQLKEKIDRCERIHGIQIATPSLHTVLRTKNIGIDFVFIATEHSPSDRIQLMWLFHMFTEMGIVPLTRIPSIDFHQARMTLDAGSKGIICPYMETVEQVKTLVGAVKLRPLEGIKLKNVQDGKIQLSETEKEYIKKFNAGNFVFLNIESVDALDNLDAMLEVEGVDGLLIGAGDLSMSLGIPDQYDSDLYSETVIRILRKAREHKKMRGIWTTGKKREKEWVKESTIILHDIDFNVFERTMRKELNEWKAFFNDPLFEK